MHCGQEEEARLVMFVCSVQAVPGVKYIVGCIL